MEANALTLLFTFTLEVEENNDGAKDNDANLAHSIIIVIENCLQLNCTSLGVATKGDFTIVSCNGKVFRLKQQVRLKQKKLG